MPTIDADAHVIETPRTWSYMRPEEQQFRPQIFVRDRDDGAPYSAGQRNEYWKIGEHFQTKTNVGDDVPVDARDMIDIQRRLDHMDQVGIDVQVLFPTLFLRPTTTEHDREYALVRSYNRWMADAWKRSGGRLRWVAIPPLYSLIDVGLVRAELEFCKANGACGVFMRGFECERHATDRYFFPLYAMAQELDLPICFHAGNNSFANHDSYDRDLGIMIFKFPVMGAFLYVATEELPARFPGLRWAFIEASAQWVPYMVREARTRLKAKGRRPSDDLLAESRFFVTTQKSDDLPGLVSEIGDDAFIIGTDYGHKDSSVEIEALGRLSEDGSITPESARKIITTNPARLYGIA
jgi:predicted TIM-barrel fold metal-dependent hydrolase